MFLFSKLILDITAIVFHLPSIYTNWGTDPKKELLDPQIHEFWSGNKDLRSKFGGSENGSEFRSTPPSSAPFHCVMTHAGTQIDVLVEQLLHAQNYSNNTSF